MEIKRFKINKLHGTLSFELKFKDNTLILVGENGSCKTTIIKMLFYTLSLQWGKLNMYNYESLEILIDDDIYMLKKEDFKVLGEMLLRELSPRLSHSFYNSIDSDGFVDFQQIDKLCRRYDIQIEKIIVNHYHTGKKQTKFLIDTMLQIKEKVKNIRVIYLPTCRRIEQNLREILGHKYHESDDLYPQIDNANYMELIEFGMRDVDDAINKTLIELKDSSRSGLNNLTLSYLGDIVDEQYSSTDIKEISNIDDETIGQIISRVDTAILSKMQKKKLLKILQSIKANKGEVKSEHERVLSHYFLKLHKSHKEMSEKETPFRNFVDVCNRYLQSKTVEYDNSNFSFNLKSNYDDHDIELDQLSSGEKQIVSLFSYLYLSNKKDCLVLIDEPELSLSVKWQKTFLEDVRKGAFCNGLVAVTHSPFIFDNSLDEYAHGIEEFRK